MDSKVSIIIPCYNAERFIAQTLQSALAQTWPEVEILVVDDCSTDQSMTIAQQYAAANVRLITKPKGGAAAARNRGLQEAQGEYVQFLDADDLLSPDKIEAQVRVLQVNPPGKVAVSATMYFRDGTDPDTGTLAGGWPLEDTDNPLDWLIQLHGGYAHPRGSMVQPGAYLVPRAIAEKAGPWDEQPSPDDDGEYFSRVVLASTGLRRSQHGFSYYRKHPSGAGNLSALRSAQDQSAALRSLELRATRILALTDSEEAKLAFARCFKQRAFLAYPFAPQVTDAALQRARELGGNGDPGDFGTWKGRLLSQVFGWKAIRRANVVYHQAIHRLKAHGA